MTGITQPSEAGGFYAEIKTLLDADRLLAALELAETAMAEGRDQVVSLFAMAAVSYRHGMLGNAIQLIREMDETGLNVADTHELLAILYCQAGLLSKALYHSKEATITPPDGRMMALFGPDLPQFSQALAAAPHRPLLRAAKTALERWNVAEALLQVEQHLMVSPEDVEAIDLYADALAQSGKTIKALGMLRSLVTMAGPKPTLLSRIGKCLTAIGRGEEGIAAHRAALTEAPGAIALWGGLVADLAYRPADCSQAAALTAEWARCVDAKAVKSPRPAPGLGQSEVVSLAFLCSGRVTPVEQEMLAKLVSGLDRNRFTTLGLGNGELSAEHNTLFRGLFDRWRNVAELDVLTLGALIRGEGVGIVLDVDGLRVPARAGLFLRKSAPLQCSWLNGPTHGAFPGANMALVSAPTGLPGEVVVPGGRYLCDVGSFPAGPLPSAAGNGFAFGADASMAEITPATAALWAQVLAAVPGSMLLLRDRGQFQEPDNVTALIELFGNFGVAHRIDVVRAELAEFCAQVDVLLAATPHFDLLESAVAVQSGLPMVILAGGPAADDLSAALAGAAVAERMVAANWGDYVALAKNWAMDSAALAQYRAAPRAALAEAAGFDRARYVQGFAQALLDHVEDVRRKAATA